VSKRQQRGRAKRRRAASNRPRKRLIAASAGLTAGALLGNGVAHAQDITVTNTDPSGAGSLRDAVATANLDADSDRILFQSGLTGSIGLGGTQLSVTQPLDVQGPGQDSPLRVNGEDSSRIFDVNAGDGNQVTISDLNLLSGHVTGASEGGGEIQVETGDLTLNRLRLEGGYATGTGAVGGAIKATDADTTVTLDQISLNGHATDFGGAIYSANGNLVVRDSFIGESVAAVEGGGILSLNGALTLENSTVIGSRTETDGTSGGGVAVEGGSGTATIDNSTIAGNRTADGYSGLGGGVYIDGAVVSLKSTIVANNRSSEGSDVFRSDGTLNSTASLIYEAPANGINGTDTGNIIGEDPELGSLSTYQGLTPFHPLSPTSPAIDQGITTIDHDQRQTARPVDDPGVANNPDVTGADGTDIGAFELQSPGTQTVTNLDDSGPGSLRAAVIASNDDASANDIVFQSGLTGTIPITTGRMNIQHPVDIEGPGANVLAVSGGGSHAIFASEPGTGDVTIAGLTLSDAAPQTFGPGAINQQNGDLTLRGVEMTGNQAAPYSQGGAVATVNGDLTVDSSTISGSTADAGGGIYFTGAQLTVQASTITGNSAVDGPGGGVYFNGSGAMVADSTIAANYAYDDGAGFYREGTAGPASLENTIVSGNTAGGPDPDVSGDLSAAFSLFQVPGALGTVTETVPGSNITGVDPQLGALAMNGGTTRTMAPAETSPAVDKGASIDPDQRGVARPIEIPSIANSTATGANGADIGAFEAPIPVTPPPSGGGPTPVSPTQPAKAKKKCKKKKHRAAAAKKCKKKRK
jgi:hypothetical protein